MDIKLPPINIFNNYKISDIPAHKKPPHQDIFVKTINQEVSFQGLTGKLGGKAFFDPNIIENEINKHPKSDGIIGNLPSAWIEKIPESQRKQAIKEIYATFREAVVNIRHSSMSYQSVQTASEKLTDTFHKWNIFKENERIYLQRLGEGKRGIGFCFSTDVYGQSNSYELKIFFQSPMNPSPLHDIYTEANRALYWLKNAGNNTQRTRFHFADLKNKFMVTQYIGRDTPPPQKIVAEKLLGLNPTDEDKFGGPLNSLRGYNYDYGGLEIISTILAQNKTARMVYKEIFQKPETERLKLWDNFLTNKKQPNYKDITLGLAASIDLIQPGERTECFKKLALNADASLREELFYKLYLIPAKSRQECHKLVDRVTA